MAHLVDSMAYLGATPWHGLGQSLPPHQSLDVWLQAAGMDWTIEQTEVLFNTAAGAQLTYPDSKILYRSDNHTPLSVVSQRYWLITSCRSANNIMPITFFLPAFTASFFYSA